MEEEGSGQLPKAEEGEATHQGKVFREGTKQLRSKRRALSRGFWWGLVRAAPNPPPPGPAPSEHTQCTHLARGVLRGWRAVTSKGSARLVAARGTWSHHSSPDEGSGLFWSLPGGIWKLPFDAQLLLVWLLPQYFRVAAPAIQEDKHIPSDAVHPCL